VVLATGPAQSAYEEFGKRYAKILARDRIDVVLLPSEGSAANLQLLREGKADLGFVQGGTSDADIAADGQLESLGSLFLEPVWLFYREEAARKVTAMAPGGKVAAADAGGGATESSEGPPQASSAPLRGERGSATPQARGATSVKARSADRPPLGGTAPSGGSAVREATSVGATLSALTQLQGLRVNVGTPGSGVPNLMTKLLESNRIDSSTLKISQLEQTPATMALLAGELDAIVFASAPESLMVQMLLQTPGVKLMDFAQSEAYSRRFAFLSPAVLPRGVVDLAANIPPQDVRLVAPTTTLLTRTSTHPALLQLFALAGNEIHGSAGWFKRAREYPNVKNNELPVAKEAERSIQAGAPLLQRYLPFWVANLVERMWLVMGIIIAILLPLSRIVPPLYQFRVRSRIFRWYGQLRNIENRAEDTQDTASLLEELNDMESHAEKISVPLSYTDELYALRNNIQLVRKKLQKL
jgi:ABC-type nitrate/sulfonate/bicarbonate transport system substrate-binding protein